MITAMWGRVCARQLRSRLAAATGGAATFAAFHAPAHALIETPPAPKKTIHEVRVPPHPTHTRCGHLPADRVSPKFRSPKFRSPKFRFPKFHSPKFRSPKVSSPKFRFPKFRSPKFRPAAAICQPSSAVFLSRRSCSRLADHGHTLLHLRLTTHPTTYTNTHTIQNPPCTLPLGEAPRRLEPHERVRALASRIPQIALPAAGLPRCQGARVRGGRASGGRFCTRWSGRRKGYPVR